MTKVSKKIIAIASMAVAIGVGALILAGTDAWKNIGADAASQSITLEQAKEKALKDAGYEEKDVTGMVAYLDRELEGNHYDIEFTANGMDYDYEISAENGKIISSDKERSDTAESEKGSNATSNDSTTANGNANSTSGNGSSQGSNDSSVSSNSSGSSSNSSDGSAISQTSAENKALSNAGLSRSNVTYVSSHLDYDDGVKVWEVSFRNGKTEYDYEINAKTGAIIEKDIDVDDDDDDYDDD